MKIRHFIPIVLMQSQSSMDFGLSENIGRHMTCSAVPEFCLITNLNGEGRLL